MNMSYYPNIYLTKEGYPQDIVWRTYSNSQCACGSHSLTQSKENELYKICQNCKTYVLSCFIADDQLDLLYGKWYWYEHQKAIGLPDIEERYNCDINDRILHWVDSVRRLINPPENILEVGCAHGRLLQELTKYGYTCDGVEYNNDIVEIAKKMSKVRVYNYLPDKKYALIIANDVLEHVYSPVSFMSELSVKLSAGGLMLTQVPMAGNDLSLKKALRPYFHTYVYSEKCLHIIANKCGLKLIAVNEGVFGTHDVVWAANDHSKWFRKLYCRAVETIVMRMKDLLLYL